jgi:hypothetical protein
MQIANAQHWIRFLVGQDSSLSGFDFAYSKKRQAGACPT